MGRLGIKIIKLVCLVLCIITIIFSVGYVYVFKKEEAKLRITVKNCIQESIKSFNGDKLDKIIKSNSKDIPEYNEMLNSMLLFKAKNDVKNFYTLKKKDDKTTLFVVDASPEAAEFLEEYEMQDEMLTAFNGKVSMTAKIYTDKWGTYLSAFAPIKNSSGEIIAIVCADTDVSIFQDLKDMFFMILIGSIGSTILISAISVFIFSKGLKRNVNSIKNSADKMNNGDLTETVKLNSKDEIEEIGFLLNDFREKIKGTFNNITNSVDEVNLESKTLSQISKEMSCSAQNVSAVIQEVAKSSTDQASEIINMNEVFNDFGQSIEHIVLLMENLYERSKTIKTKSTKSSNSIDILQNTIGGINAHFKDVTTKIQGLSSSITKINDITKLINSIAEQTNLLALNAAIEAARAGEAGRGFSIVADEIRKLAEQSKESAENINELLKNLSSESNSVVVNTESVDSKMLDQTMIINDVAGSLKEILTDIEELLPEIQTVSSSIVEANNKKRTISAGVETLSNVAENISASAEEIAAISEGLSTSTVEVVQTSENLVQMMKNVTDNLNKFKTK
ncbi:MAG: methyl-accepting chemotaxis protein [Clostridiaceae bacterium]|nr:methyl-accepting chemotaxis protein [Clostridiaceae bacterium]